MANSGPGKLTITSTTGPGVTVTAAVLLDVASIEFDLMRNVVKVTRTGSGGIQYYDFSAIATGTITITAGLPIFVLST